MASALRPVERTIAGRRWLIGYFPPSKAIPLMGRLVAFLGPVAKGPAAEAVRGLARVLGSEGWSELDYAGIFTRLAAGVDGEALVRGVFEVRWDDPALTSLLRDLLDVAVCTDGKTQMSGAAALDDQACVGPFAGPEGLETLATVVWAILVANFKLPFFSRMSAVASRNAVLLAQAAEVGGSPARTSSSATP